MSDDGYRGYRSLPVKWGSLHASAARSTLGASTMDASLGLNIFTVLFLSGTFLAAVVAGLGGFALWDRWRRRLAVHSFAAADRDFNHGSRACRAGLLSLEIAARIKLATADAAS